MKGDYYTLIESKLNEGAVSDQPSAFSPGVLNIIYVFTINFIIVSSKGLKLIADS